jgi:hypothetical protein
MHGIRSHFLLILLLLSCGKESSNFSIKSSRFSSTNSAILTSPFTVSSQETVYQNNVFLEGTLISFYHMNESNGTILYDTKGANHGSYNVGASSITQGVTGALAGAGLGAYFSAPTTGPLGGVGQIPISSSLTLQDSVTIEFWTKMPVLAGSWLKPIFMGEVSAYPYGVWGLEKTEDWRCTNNGIPVLSNCWGWQFSVVDPGPSATFATYPTRQVIMQFDADIADNNWHHIVAIFDNSAAGGLNTDVAKIYIDGNLKTVFYNFIYGGSDHALESNNWLYGKQLGNYSSYGIGLGAPADGGWGPLQIYFDEIALYDGPLSPATITTHYGLRL